MLQKWTKHLFVLVVLAICGAPVGAAAAELPFPPWDPSQKLAWVPALPNLPLDYPIGVGAVPGQDNGRVYWGRDGRLYYTEDDQQFKQIMDLSPQSYMAGDMGVTNVVFHHDFPKTRYVFVTYPYSELDDTGRQNALAVKHERRLSRFEVGTDMMVDLTSEVVLLSYPTHLVWHFGGGAFFHPEDKFLYFGLGDAGNHRAPQDPKNYVLGGIFRIDVDRRGGSVSAAPEWPLEKGKKAHYFIPNDNPTYGTGITAEAIAIGARNPWKVSYDPKSKKIYFVDVGEVKRDEFNVLDTRSFPGINLQWPYREGDLERKAPTEPMLGISTPPVVSLKGTYIGGYVYRGKKHPDWVGKYLMSNFWQGELLLQSLEEPFEREQVAKISRFKYHIWAIHPDAEGEPLFALSQPDRPVGGFFRLKKVNNGVAQVPPLKSMLFLSADALRAEGYRVYFPQEKSLYFDNHAQSESFVVLPETAPSKDTFKVSELPGGSVFVKHLWTKSDEQQKRLIETQVLVKQMDKSVYARSYRWLDNGEDATVVERDVKRSLTVASTKMHWTHQTEGACLNCHNPSQDYILGFKNVSREPVPIPKRDEFWTSEQQPFAAMKLAKLEDKVSAYMEDNCSFCHNDLSIKGWHVKRGDRLQASGLMGPARREIAGMQRLVVPGNPDKSLLWRRVHSTQHGVRMPPVGRFTRDDQFSELLADWINALPQPQSQPKAM